VLLGKMESMMWQQNVEEKMIIGESKTREIDRWECW
jgi:hypothetical protein